MTTRGKLRWCVERGGQPGRGDPRHQGELHRPGEPFQISQKYLTNYNQANFFKYLKNLTDYNQANFFKCLKNLTNCNQANLDKYPVSGDICHRYYLFTIIEGFWDYQVVRVRFLPFCSETLQFNVSTLFAVKTCVSWRWVRDATRGATGCPIGIQVIINSLQLLLEFRKTPSCRKGIFWKLPQQLKICTSVKYVVGHPSVWFLNSSPLVFSALV